MITRFLVLCLALAGTAAAAPNPRAGGTIRLVVNGRANAHVSLASRGSFVAAAWSASEPSGATDIYLAISRDGGTRFAPPVRVNEKPGDAHVNGEQPPRVALIEGGGPRPAIVVVWTSKSVVGTTIVYARSEDGGRRFGPTTVVPGGEAAGNRGWQNVTVDASGAVRVLWLDHREMTPSKSGAGSHRHEGHGAAPHDTKDGAAAAQPSKLYLATIGAPGSARMLLGGVCYCCKTAIVAGKNGVLYAAWRHVYPGNFRDVAFAVSQNGGQTFLPPIRVSEDRWQLEGCPDDGPAMAVDDTNGIHVVWPTLVTDALTGQPSIGIFYAYSVDGRSFSPRQRLQTEGLAHHPQVAVSRGTLTLAWDELQKGMRRIVVARRPQRSATGAPFRRAVVGSGDGAIYPSLAAVDAGMLLGWSTAKEGASAIRLVALEQ